MLNTSHCLKIGETILRHCVHTKPAIILLSSDLVVQVISMHLTVCHHATQNITGIYCFTLGMKGTSGPSADRMFS